MAEPICEATTMETPKDRAKALVLKQLGAKRVAGWCGVTENAIHQGLSRATDDAPVPIAWAPKIIAGAKREGIAIPIAALWPSMAGMFQ